MTQRKLHIVAFDVPYPADYGGVIDVYYRIKALYELGFEIVLHCFEYGRGEQQMLSEVTHQVHYYKRSKRLMNWFSSTPFIVQTRKSDRLVDRLLEDDTPILFEGLHTTAALLDPRIQQKKTLVRLHNIEHEYYAQLAESTKGWKRIYYSSEAWKLKRYEETLALADHLLVIKESDGDYFNKYSNSITYLPACFDLAKSDGQQSTKTYALFHGDLGVEANVASVQWLAQNVFPITDVQWIVAGKQPSKEIRQMAQSVIFELVEDPSDTKMKTLIDEARMHVLFATANSGIKLKLLLALQSSGHVLVNQTMILGTSIAPYCTVLSTPEEWKSSIRQCIHHELDADQYDQRRRYILDTFDPVHSCKVIGDLIMTE